MEKLRTCVFFIISLHIHFHCLFELGLLIELHKSLVIVINKGLKKSL